MRIHRKQVIGAVGVMALAAGVVSISSMSAQAAPTPGAAVVINEVYGGGGNSGAFWNRDFVELTNVSAAPVNLTGWSVQYTSATGAGTWQKTDLTGTLPAGTSYVVGEAVGAGTGTTAVPVDVDGSIAMSGTAGKVALVNNGVALTGCATTCSQQPQVVDFVGFGTTANDYAGTGPTPAPSNTASVSRNASHANTANNAADFAATTPPTPTPCADACVAGPTPPQRAHDRPDPGHRRSLPGERQLRDHQGCRHRGLPDRWVPRLLPADPGHRTRAERIGRLRRCLRLPAQRSARRGRRGRQLRAGHR